VPRPKIRALVGELFATVGLEHQLTGIAFSSDHNPPGNPQENSSLSIVPSAPSLERGPRRLRSLPRFAHEVPHEALHLSAAGWPPTLLHVTFEELWGSVIDLVTLSPVGEGDLPWRAILA
jgi:hypothetical protein